MDATPVDVDDQADGHVAFLEHENAKLAELAITEVQKNAILKQHLERATRDVAALELMIEEHERLARIQRDSLLARLGRLEDLHMPTTVEHHAVTSIVRHAQKLRAPGLEVHVFVGARRLI